MGGHGALLCFRFYAVASGLQPARGGSWRQHEPTVRPRKQKSDLDSQVAFYLELVGGGGFEPPTPAV
jgi:hypothetical protein